MALSIRNIKRWYSMLAGKSVWHVNQNLGITFSTEEIRGYYNNMTDKVIKMPEILDNDELPQLEIGKGKNVFFPVAIFQYGLGAYDLYIISTEERYAKKFLQCVEWTFRNQDDKGRWNNFAHYTPETPYGAMAQGEGASLLIRAYIYSKEIKYLEAARKAIDFMLLPLEDGGTTKYEDDNAYLMEYTFKGLVLNGAIFAWWGLYDYVLATHDEGKYKEAKDKTLNTILNVLPSFTYSFWSKYSLDGLIASPFYHHLHVAQMQGMYHLTGNVLFDEYAKRWERKENSLICKTCAFVIKAIQKLEE